MRNMGRLFQYNRFVGSDEAAEDNTKDTQTSGGWKNNKPQQQFGANCPAYAELYPAYACNASSIEITATPAVATTATATTTTAATTMTSRSIDLALRKYQQWSSKFLPTINNSNNGNNTMSVLTTEEKHTTIATMPVATNADCVTHLSTSSSSQKSNSCSHSCSYNTTTNTSGYYSRLTLVGNVSAVDMPQTRGELQQQHGWGAAGGDRELLVSAGKRPKVYDCMKDFLRRKLFQQRHGQQQEQQQRTAQMAATLCKSDTEEDVTSDYDEVDMLDSSYNADEEDASDCSSQCTCPLESDVEEVVPQQQQYACNVQQQQQKQGSTPQKSISPQKSMLSLNCWQNITQYTDSTTEPEEDEDVDGGWDAADADYQHVAEDSDAGISDCCQLISEKSSPTKQRKRQQKQKQQKQKSRHNRNSDDGGEEAELLASSWYQPRITTKAALERLQQSPPGSFLLRRKSRSYELCLRVETKVKHFVVVSLADNHYKLKGAKKQFTSLKALVTHHSVMAEQLPLTLALPREYASKSSKAYAVSDKWAASEAFDVGARTLRSLRYADDFDTYESLQILGLLQDWQCEANEY